MSSIRIWIILVQKQRILSRYFIKPPFDHQISREMTKLVDFGLIKYKINANISIGQCKMQSLKHSLNQMQNNLPFQRKKLMLRTSKSSLLSKKCFYFASMVIFWSRYQSKWSWEPFKIGLICHFCGKFRVPGHLMSLGDRDNICIWIKKGQFIRCNFDFSKLFRVFLKDFFCLITVSKASKVIHTK